MNCKLQSGGEFDVQSFLSKLPFTTTGIKGELHMPFPVIHNFEGPGTNTGIRLNPDDTPKEWSKPVDIDDEYSRRHDIAYRDCKNNLPCTQEADRI